MKASLACRGRPWEHLQAELSPPTYMPGTKNNHPTRHLQNQSICLRCSGTPQTQPIFETNLRPPGCIRPVGSDRPDTPQIPLNWPNQPNRSLFLSRVRIVALLRLCFVSVSSISSVLAVDVRSAVRPSYKGWVRGVRRGPYHREQDRDHRLEGEARLAACLREGWEGSCWESGEWRRPGGICLCMNCWILFWLVLNYDFF